MFLQRLRGESDLERGRLLAESTGKFIGTFDQALEASIKAQDPDAAVVCTPLRIKVVGSGVNELLSLCEWKIAGVKLTAADQSSTD